MCGLVGFLGCSEVNNDNGGASLLHAMARRIESRGPDDKGAWFDAAQAIGLGHVRLAIVDLSSAGHQPMVSTVGRYVIAFNGEIYNHLLLRKQLNGFAWRGYSDTETLLAGFDAWGIEATVKRCIGMFAFAVWDKTNHCLTLGRDRIGEKPLYYGWQGNTFLFGSELKALKAHPAFRAEINRDALALMMRHNAISAPYSIYQGIHKLLPGSLLTVSLQNRTTEPQRYWDAHRVVDEGLAHPFTGSPGDAVDELEKLLKDAIGQQMLADVPLGAFLSGGVDSSTVVALMQAQSAIPVKTFSIGFHEVGYNEAEHARAVAQHLETQHTELYVTAQQAMDVIPRLPTLYDEPFSDSSQIPTFLVSQLARQHVTVSLSGDAGDELFCGYNRYQLTASLWNKLSHIPRPLRLLAEHAITSASPAAWNRFAKTAQGIPGLGALAARWSNVGDKLHKGSAVLASRSAIELYSGMVSHWAHPANLVIGSHEPETLLNGPQSNINGLSDVQRMMMLDLLTYLPDDILTKVDRAAMGVGLETRVPFLDHRVVEFAWSMPMEYKLREGQTKWALRQVLYKHVPKELIERPKMGFGVPIDTWLRGPLRDWAESLLDESRLLQEGFFNPAPVRQKWAEHLSGQRNWQYHLWDVLMFQAWFETAND